MKNYIVLDTEGVDTVKNDSVNAKTSLCYDIGFIVFDGKTHDKLAEYSFINTDVFKNIELMASAYYANKLPQYYAGINKEWILANTLEIWQTLANVCKTYNVNKIWAYNSNYDVQALNNTIATYSNGFKTYFIPYGVKVCDIWDYAGSTILNTRKYINYCIKHNYITSNGNPQTSAEIVTRYLNNDNDFIENHTALQDCYIEHNILMKCFKRHAKQPKTKGSGWRIPSKLLKQLLQDNKVTIE